MSRALLDHVVQSSLKKVPALRAGATVHVHQKIKEGEKERIQIFKGLVIRVNAGHKTDKTFTVRKVVEGVGVEKIFPFHSSMIEKIEIIKQGRVRRAKLFYMRDLEGKSTRLRETAFELGMLDETAGQAEQSSSEADSPIKEEAAPEEEQAQEQTQTASDDAVVEEK